MSLPLTGMTSPSIFVGQPAKYSKCATAEATSTARANLTGLPLSSDSSWASSSPCVSAARNSRTGSAISVAAMRSPRLRLQDDLQRLAPVVERIGLGRVGERHVMGDERTRVQAPRGQQREHGIEMADHVGLPGLQL